MNSSLYCSDLIFHNYFTMKLLLKFFLTGIRSVNFFHETTGEWKTWMIVLVICAPMFAAAVLAGSCAVLHYRRRTGTQNGRPHAVDEGKSQHDLLHNLVTPTTAAAITQEFNSLNSEELSFMEVATIRAATNEFSDSNKLGHGGFGTVYKVPPVLYFVI